MNIKRKKREVDEEIEGRKVEGTRKVANRRACTTSRVQLNVLRRSFTKQEIITHYQRQLRYYPELKCYSRVRGKLERGDMGTSLWDGKPTMTIASLRLDGSGVNHGNLSSLARIYGCVQVEKR